MIDLNKINKEIEKIYNYIINYDYYRIDYNTNSNFPPINCLRCKKKFNKNEIALRYGDNKNYYLCLNCILKYFNQILKIINTYKLKNIKDKYIKLIEVHNRHKKELEKENIVEAI